MKATYAYGAATSQGTWPVQEDGYFVDPSTGIFALADGFGGRGAGDLAVKLALHEIRNSKAGDHGPREGGILSPMQAWHRDQFGEINKKILQWNEKRSPSTKGGCSLLLGAVEKEGNLTITGCGACSAFLVRGGKMIPLLSSQSEIRSSETGALFPSQALGLGRELLPESRTIHWEGGDVLLFFSSGLAWERDGFQSELVAQLSLREVGSDLGGVASMAAEFRAEGAPWNQTALVVEARKINT